MTKPTSEQVTFLAAGTGATQRTVLDKLRDVVSVDDYGAVGDGVADDTAAIQACVDAAKNGTNKNIYIPAGTYLISHVDMIGLAYSNLTFIGEGMPTFVFKLPPGGRQTIPGYANPTFARTNLADGMFVLDANSANQYTNDANSIKNVTFIGIKFQMNVAVDGFDELMHCVCASGTSGLYFDHCQFIGFMGDGIAVCRGRGTGPVIGSWPSFGYNANLVVTNCIFDGVNKDNRQAISIYYCDGFTIMDNVFKNTTRSDMPGAIDIEPDNDLTTTRCGVIWRNSFDNIGGAGAVVIICKPTNTDLTATRNIDIAFNKFTNIDEEVLYAIYQLQTSLDKSTNLSFRNNYCHDFGDMFVVANLTNVLIENNFFHTSNKTTNLTPANANIVDCYNAVVKNNTFVAIRKVLRTMSYDKIGLVIATADATPIPESPVDIIGNAFIDCGSHAVTANAGHIGEFLDNAFVSSIDTDPFCLYSAAGTVARYERTSFSNNALSGTFSSGTNGKNSVTKLFWISGGGLPTTYNAKTPETFDYGTTIFESTGVFPESPAPASTNGMLVTIRLKDPTSISVAQYFYPAFNDPNLFVYYRHAASNTTWQSWRKFSQTVI